MPLITRARAVGRPVPGAAAGERAAQQLAGDGHAVALVLAEGHQRAEQAARPAAPRPRPGRSVGRPCSSIR